MLLFLTTVYIGNAIAGDDLERQVVLAQRAVIEARDEAGVKAACANRPSLADKVARSTTEEVSTQSYFTLARTLIALEIRCGSEFEARRQFQQFRRVMPLKEALKKWDDLPNLKLDPLMTPEGVEFKIPEEEWHDLLIHGYAIQPNHALLEKSLQVIAQKKWVETLQSLRSYLNRERHDDVPERWRPYLREIPQNNHLFTVEDEYLKYLAAIVEHTPTLGAFVDNDSLTGLLKALGYKGTPDDLVKIGTISQQIFNDVETRQDVLSRWPTTVFHAGPDGSDLVRMVGYMQKLSLQEAIRQVLELSRDQTIAMIESTAFDAAVDAFVEKNKASAKVLRIRLDDAIKNGHAKARESELGKAALLFSRSAWNLVHFQEQTHPVDLEALDVTFRDIKSEDELRPEYKELVAETERSVTEIVKAEASADWSEVRAAYEKALKGFGDGRAEETSARTTLEADRAKRMVKARAQWVALGKLWHLDSPIRPTLGELKLTPVEEKRYVGYLEEISKNRARLFETLPEARRKVVLKALSTGFGEMLDMIRERTKGILALRQQIMDLMPKGSTPTPEDVAKIQTRLKELDAQIETAKENLTQEISRSSQALIPFIQECLLPLEGTLLGQINLFERPMASRELEPLLFSGYVQETLSFPAYQGLQRIHNQRQEAFFDHGNWSVFMDGVMGFIFEAPIYLSYYPKIALVLLRPFGKELFKQTLLQRGINLLRDTLSVGKALFHPLLHPKGIGHLMSVLIYKDWGAALIEWNGIFGVEWTNLATLLPFDVGPTGWYRHYDQYFNASIGDDGLITAAEKRQKTHEYQNQRDGMVQNIKTILWYQITGGLAGRLGGGWTRADIKAVRRVGIIKAAKIALRSNSTNEAEIASALRVLRGRPEEFRWDADYIEGLYNAALADRGDRRTRPDLIEQAKNRILYELEMGKRRWQVIADEYAPDLAALGVRGFDIGNIRIAKEAWDQAYHEGRVSFAEHATATAAYQSLQQLIGGSEKVSYANPYMQLLLKTGMNPEAPPARIQDLQGGKLLGELLQGGRVRELVTEATTEKAELDLVRAGKTRLPWVDADSERRIELELRLWEQRYPNMQIKRVNSDREGASGYYEVVYDLRNQENVRIQNEGLAAKLGFEPRKSFLSRLTEGVLTRARMREKVSLEDRWSGYLEQIGLNPLSDKTWFEALDADTIRSAADVAARANPDESRAIERAKIELISGMVDLEIDWKPTLDRIAAKTIRTREVKDLEELRSRSAFHRAIFARIMQPKR